MLGLVSNKSVDGPSLLLFTDALVTRHADVKVDKDPTGMFVSWMGRYRHMCVYVCVCVCLLREQSIHS